MFNNFLNNVIKVNRYDSIDSIKIPNGQYFIRIYPELDNNSVFKGRLYLKNDIVHNYEVGNIEILKVGNDILKNNNKIIYLNVNSENNNCVLYFDFINKYLLSVNNVNIPIHYIVFIAKIGE